MKNIQNIKVVLLNAFVILFILSNYNCGDFGVNSNENLGGKTITVSGIVIDEFGKPLQSAQVTLNLISNVRTYPSLSVSTSTNSKGQYSISNFYKFGPIGLSVSKTITDSLGVFRYYNTYLIKVQWTDDPQVFNFKVKLF